MTDTPIVVPLLRACEAAVSVDKKSGVEALGVLPDQLRERCPELANILEDAEVQGNLGTFGKHDKEAISQQESLMKEATWANICLMAAGVTSGVALAVAASAEPSSLSSGILIALGLATIILGAAGTYFGSFTRDQDRLGRWRTSRSQAEMARLSIFNAISSKAAAAGAVAALYGLAVVVVHLLNDQRSYLEGRARRHRQSSEITSRWSALASGLAFIGGGGAFVASQVQLGVWIVLAGVFGAATASFATNREALRRDRANADRYEKAQVALDALAASRNRVEDHVRNDPQALVIFTGAIAEQLSTEHRQWLEGTSQAEALLDKMETQFRQLTERRNGSKSSDKSEAHRGQS